MVELGDVKGGSFISAVASLFLYRCNIAPFTEFGTKDTPSERNAFRQQLKHYNSLSPYCVNDETKGATDLSGVALPQASWRHQNTCDNVPALLHNRA